MAYLVGETHRDVIETELGFTLNNLNQLKVPIDVVQCCVKNEFLIRFTFSARTTLTVYFKSHN